MYNQYNKMLFLNHVFCYSAKNIYETNTIIIWGSLSIKLINTIVNQIENSIDNRVIIHLRGCDKRIDNKYSYSSLNNVLPINLCLSTCMLKNEDYQKLIHEARQCLKA